MVRIIRRSTGLWISLAIVFCFALSAAAQVSPDLFSAQRGSAPGGYYPPGYHGDTWTGAVTTTDDKTRTVTLTYSSKKKTETFTGVLKEGCCKVKMSDGTVQELKPSELSPGRRVMVYYIPRTTKADGKESTVNEVFRVDFLK
ncbi:MAG TPA: hypothetical protein VN785_03670 [Candidatus Angelobacter sp.]|nr:hypothetical protein [Candidatus Angelobacter sp.]